MLIISNANCVGIKFFQLKVRARSEDLPLMVNNKKFGEKFEHENMFCLLKKNISRRNFI